MDKTPTIPTDAEGVTHAGESMLDFESHFRVVEGVVVPIVFELACKRPMQEHVQKLKVMNMTSDDVIIAAFIKAGTHWIWEVVSMLLQGKAEYEKRTKEFAMMEATPIEQLQSQPSPRVLNSHLPMKLLPLQIKEKKVKVIHVYRNVKDILVSAYFHFRQVEEMKDITLEWLERTAIAPDAPGYNYFKYLQDMDDFRKNNPGVSFFCLSFEDTKENPEDIIVKLADFLGVACSTQLLKDIAEATSLTRMKKAHKEKDKTHILDITDVYRKGEVGDWKNYLTVAQSERLDAAMTLLQSCDYRFRFTL